MNDHAAGGPQQPEGERRWAWPKLFGGVLPLTRAGAARDALAGLTLASMNIPQVLGYTRIVGMPIVTGLYTVLLPVLAFAVFGSSRHLVVAADSATAAILAASVSNLATPQSPRYVALVGAAALLAAALLLVARAFRLGFLADFFSRTVLVGFLTGVGFQVGIAMLGGMSGIAVESQHTLEQLWQLLRGLPTLHGTTFALSVVVAASIVLGRRVAPRLPTALFVVVASIAASAALGFAEHGIAVIGPVPGGLPTLALPDVSWHDALSVLSVAVSCFVMIVAQSAATARAFASRHQERVDVDADILGLAAANAAAALSGTFVVNGSPTQTAMADDAGARSQVAQLAFAGVVLVVLLALTGPLQYLPRCVLASIVFTIAAGMVDVASLRDIGRASQGEFRLAVLTAVAVVVLGVEHGLLLAVGLSLLQHVRRSYRPNSAVMVRDASGQPEFVPATPGVQSEPGLLLYRFAADLFFANENRFADEVRALVAQAPTPLRWFIVDASAITDIDYTAAHSLRRLVAELEQHGVTLLLARVTPFLRAELDRHGITAAVGAGRVFATLHEAVDTAHGGATAAAPLGSPRSQRRRTPTAQPKE